MKQLLYHQIEIYDVMISSSDRLQLRSVFFCEFCAFSDLVE